MSIVSGKCPNCGAPIKVDKDKDAGICEFCGSPFVTEKAIVNFGTYINKQEVNNYAKKQDNEYSVKLKELKLKEDEGNFKKAILGFGFAGAMLLIMIIMSILEKVL